MKSFLLTMPAVAAILLSGAAHADLELAKKSGCMACHAVDKKVVGPAWQDVAAKYKGDSSAKATIVSSLENGSRGKWGQVPMPAQKRLTAEERDKLAEYVISLAE
ncbi:MAG: c-type cytochrome [Pseudomonadota bacterium]